MFFFEQDFTNLVKQVFTGNNRCWCMQTWCAPALTTNNLIALSCIHVGLERYLSRQ